MTEIYYIPNESKLDDIPERYDRLMQVCLIMYNDNPVPKTVSQISRAAHSSIDSITPGVSYLVGQSFLRVTTTLESPRHQDRVHPQGHIASIEELVERDIKREQSQKRYAHTDKGVGARHKYWNSDRGRTATSKYWSSPKGREAQKRYRERRKAAEMAAFQEKKRQEALKKHGYEG